MKNNLEKIKDVTAILVGSTSGLLKETLSKIPNVKIIDVDSKREKIEIKGDREKMKKDIIKKIGLISIPVLACVSILAGGINRSNKKKQMNDEINNIDSINDAPYKVEPTKNIDTVLHEISVCVTERVSSQFKLADEDALQESLEILFKTKEKTKLIRYLAEIVDYSTRRNIILYINHHLDLTSGEFGVLDLPQIKISADEVDVINRYALAFQLSQLIYSVIPEDYNRISETKILDVLLEMTFRPCNTQLIKLLTDNGISNDDIVTIILSFEDFFVKKNTKK